jgi:hypothetical protein
MQRAIIQNDFLSGSRGYCVTNRADQFAKVNGTSGGIRTPGLLLRRNRALTRSIHNFFSFHSSAPFRDSAFARSISLSRGINRVWVQFGYSPDAGVLPTPQRWLLLPTSGTWLSVDICLYHLLRHTRPACRQPSDGPGTKAGSRIIGGSQGTAWGGYPPCSFIGPAPPAGDYAIMPSTVRLSSTSVLTAIRDAHWDAHWIEAWRSDDDLQTITGMSFRIRMGILPQ